MDVRKDLKLAVTLFCSQRLKLLLLKKYSTKNKLSTLPNMFLSLRTYPLILSRYGAVGRVD